MAKRSSGRGSSGGGSGDFEKLASEFGAKAAAAMVEAAKKIEAAEKSASDREAKRFGNGIQSVASAGSKAAQGRMDAAAGQSSPFSSAFVDKSGLGAAGQGIGEAGSLGGLAGGIAGSAFSGAVSGAGQGIGRTAPGSLSSPQVLGQNTLVGAAEGALQNTVGKIPVIGDYVMAQFNSFEEARTGPAKSTAAKLGDYYGSLEAAGVHFSDEEKRSQAARGISMERTKLQERRKAQRFADEQNADTGIGFGLSMLGF